MYTYSHLAWADFKIKVKQIAHSTVNIKVIIHNLAHFAFKNEKYCMVIYK